MKALVSELLPSLRATLVLTAVTCGAYPLAITGIAQTFFKDKAHGSLVRDADGHVRGSILIGQSFASDRYFHPRPSAAGAGYDAANSSGSNLGPTSSKLNEAIKERVTTYRTLNGLPVDAPVPADAVTASASGLDPHISVRNAELQATRVAEARNLSLETLREMISARTEKSTFGPDAVNVLVLNQQLDAMK